MRLLQILSLALAATLISSKEIDSNDINAAPPPINLDSNLRKALLRALSELESEDERKRDDAASTTDPTADKIVERASAAAVSIYANDAPSTTTIAPASSTTTTDEQIVIIQKSKGFQPKSVISVENPGNEEFVASASSSFARDRHNLKSETVQTRSVSPNSVSVNDKSFTAGVKSVSITPKPESTTPLPTTTTAENEAKVEDVQFFSAPLVAAFTVHQDERGLPKKVEPIFRIDGQNSVSAKDLEQQQQQQQQQAENLRIDLLRHEQQREQIFIQEKQKALEQQVFELQQQKKQQELLLKQQQLYLEQQLANQKLLLEQQRIQQNEQPFVPIVNPTNQFLPPNNNKFTGKTLVSLQPSLSLTAADLAAGTLPLNAQVLPVRNANDFLQSPPPFNLFNQPPQFTPPIQQQPAFQTFQNFPNNFVQSLPNRQSTRTFRQEQFVGNLGLNSNQFQQQLPQQQQQPNRFFRSNVEGFHTRPNFVNQQNANQQLNNLLYHSGITRGVRQSEDLNIVSKILTYNVGRDNLFAGSRANEHRVPAASIH